MEAFGKYLEFFFEWCGVFLLKRNGCERQGHMYKFKMTIHVEKIMSFSKDVDSNEKSHHTVSKCYAENAALFLTPQTTPTTAVATPRNHVATTTNLVTDDMRSESLSSLYLAYISTLFVCLKTVPMLLNVCTFRVSFYF